MKNIGEILLIIGIIGFIIILSLAAKGGCYDYENIFLVLCTITGLCTGIGIGKLIYTNKKNTK